MTDNEIKLQEIEKKLKGLTDLAETVDLPHEQRAEIALKLRRLLNEQDELAEHAEVPTSTTRERIVTAHLRREIGSNGKVIRHE